MALLMLLPALAGCGNLPHPFQPEYKGDENFSLMPIDKAGMVVRPVDGLPPAAADAFGKALIEALRREDVAAMAGPGNPASLVLAGAAVPGGAGWEIRLSLGDPKASRLGEVVSRANPLQADDPKSWDASATALARSVVAILKSDPALAPGDAPNVALGEVLGLAGGDGRALLRALEYTLRTASVQIAADPAKATHTVSAEVTVGPLRGAAERQVRKVEVRWTVRRADDSDVGEVKQSNDVPAEILDRAWPDVAFAVATAATGDIVDLVNRRAAVTR